MPTPSQLQYGMRVLIQRVSDAQVSIAETNEVVGKIDKGLFLLVGFKKGDTEEDVLSLSSKLLKLRVMSDEHGKMNKTVTDVEGSYLIVSQFTLYANTKDGNRPSFLDSLDPEAAKKLYAFFVDKMYEGNAKVATGSFGDYMKIDTNLDGPVTIILES